MAGETNIVPVYGFQITKFAVTKGKKEEEVGKISVTLEAQKDDLRAMEHDINDILGAMNMHNSTDEAIAVQLRF